METQAVVFEKPETVSLRTVDLVDPGPNDLVVDVRWSGISTGTERLLWSGAMPPFPGMGYPLVPGYEAVGSVSRTAQDSQIREGDMVFIPGASCYSDVKGLFGGSAARLVVPADRAVAVDDSLQDQASLLALAATAHHALADNPLPDLIVGHGVLGRLMARLCIALGGETPVVWETNPIRRTGVFDYPVIHPDEDSDSKRSVIVDVSGAKGVIDLLVPKLRPGGEIVLAGFYDARLDFGFVPAFMREAKFRIAAEWKDRDLKAALALVESGALSLDGLVSNHCPASQAQGAYQQAFQNPECLKMILDWSAAA